MLAAHWTDNAARHKTLVARLVSQGYKKIVCPTLSKFRASGNVITNHDGPLINDNTFLHFISYHFYFDLPIFLVTFCKQSRATLSCVCLFKLLVVVHLLQLSCNMMALVIMLFFYFKQLPLKTHFESELKE